MAYRLEFKPAALRDLKRLPKPTNRRLAKSIEALAEEPRPRGVKKLQGKAERVFYRLRVGDYRVIYQVHDDVVLVLIVRVAGRKEIYRLQL